MDALRARARRGAAARAAWRAGALLLLCLAAARGSRAAPCGFLAARAVAVRSIDAHVEPLLADGRRIVFPELVFPENRRESARFRRAARARLTRWLAGRSAVAVVTDARPDRWGRTAARLYAPAPGGARGSYLWVEQAIVGAGLARVMPPSRGSAACLPVLLSAEAQARRAGLGLWRDPYYASVSATDRAALRRRVGQWVIVKGRIASIGAAGARVYLNFGLDKARDLALSANKKNARLFASSGHRLADYVGKQVQARGLLETWFGPRIDLFSPSQIAILAAAGAPQAKAPAP